MRGFIITTLLILTIPCVSPAQGPDTPPGATGINFNYDKYEFKGDFPFDRPFYIRIDKPPKGADSVAFFLSSTRNHAATFSFISGSKLFHDSFFLPFNAPLFGNRLLLPDHDYTARLVFYDASGQMLPGIEPIEFGFTTATKFANYTAADFGFSYVSDLKAAVGFATVHVYLTALNPETDLMEIRGFSRNFFLRTSFFAGAATLPLNPGADANVKELLGIGNFVYGIGFRSPFYGPWLPWLRNKAGRIFLQPMRLNAGEILYQQLDENNILNREHSFYVGVSYDLNISKLFGSISKLTSP